MTRKPPRRPTAMAAAAAGLALVAVSLTSFDQPPAQAGPVDPDRAAAASGVPISGLEPGTYSVTLITGDRVNVAVDREGHTAVDVKPARRADGTKARIDVTQTDDAIYAIPDDVRPALAAGRLDEGLFDVATLIANGYDDRSSKTLPVIMQYAQDATKRELRVQADELPATPHDALGLSSINAAAVDVAKGSIDRFWAELRPTAERSTTRLRSGVEKIWLDYKATVTLDQSVPMIGAPAAWDAGFDGSGVRVAVLDTGIDQNHPDLESKVVASRSFVGGTVADGNGHGTHVASTVAGSGAGSDGRYKGVAPGADLIVGKVLPDTGNGPISNVIAGMEWATVEEQADIVSMSLGCDDCSADGTEPQDQAVDQLTAQTGALFVIAAGNSGPNSQTVSSPGSADTALTVAAVDRSDRLANFSSRGPRRGDGALKPEIAAPGVGIVAARAGGAQIGDLYTSSTGTSMATPHVAGAAAILAQKYPDWTPEQLKAALMSTARDVGYNAHQQGAGRVDVAKAISQTVFAATPKLDFRNVEPTDDPVTKTLSYVNTGGADVTLTLEASVESANGPIPDGSLTLSQSSLTVPAGGTASVEVTLTPPGDSAGAYTGTVLATGPGDVRVSTPIGFTQYTEVTITLDRRHQGADDTSGEVCAGLMYSGAGGASVGTAGVRELCWTGASADTTLLLPAGPYFLVGEFEWPSGGADQLGYVFRQEVWLDEGMHLTLDADETRPIRLSTPRPAEIEQQKIQFRRMADADGNGYLRHVSDTISDPSNKVWVSGAPKPTVGDFVFAPSWSMAAPGDGPVGTRPYYYVIQPYESQVPADARFAYPAKEFALVKNYIHAAADEPQTGTLSWYTVHDEDYNLSATSEFPGVAVSRVVPVYLGPISNPDVRLGQFDQGPGSRAVEHGAYAFPDAKTYEVHWGEQPVVPGPVYTPEDARLEEVFLLNHPAGFLFGACSGCREGDQFSPMMLMTPPDRRNSAGYAGGATQFEDPESALDGLHLYGPDGDEIPGRVHFSCDGESHPPCGVVIE